MTSETIVAVFDDPSTAARAVAALETAGVPRNAIHHYDRSDEEAGNNTSNPDVETHHHTGFWNWLTGSDTDHEHHALYDHTVKSGGTVVTVVSDSNRVDEISRILEQHGPVDLEERHSQYQTTGAYGTAYGTAGDAVNAETASRASTTSGTDTPDEQVIPLAEEQLEVGKRDVDRGTTRVRRYTVSRDASEQIRLRDESVSVLRRPVSGNLAVGADAFTDREISATEIDEEAVVGKSAHVVEEVVLKKSVGHHDETVHGDVRREEIEVTGPKGHDLDKTPSSKT